jgi:hypothetical protein
VSQSYQIVSGKDSPWDRKELARFWLSLPKTPSAGSWGRMRGESERLGLASGV